MMMVIQWFLWFIGYSFMGWVYETSICSISQKKFINRGFLKGPVCPVYGFGALVCILFLYQKTENVLILFFLGMLLTCTVEYITSVLLEKLFNSKWWDYSNRRFNLNGRICLLGAMVFGVLSVILIKVLHPLISELTAQVPERLQVALAGVLFFLIIWDLNTTLRHLMWLNQQLKDIQTTINKIFRRKIKCVEEVDMTDLLEESELNNVQNETLFSLNKIQNTRLFRAFPNFRSVKYREALEVLKSLILVKKK